MAGVVSCSSRGADLSSPFLSAPTGSSEGGERTSPSFEGSSLTCELFVSTIDSDDGCDDDSDDDSDDDCDDDCDDLTFFVVGASEMDKVSVNRRFFPFIPFDSDNVIGITTLSLFCLKLSQIGHKLPQIASQISPQFPKQFKDPLMPGVIDLKRKNTTPLKKQNPRGAA
jgi:hypothetical protein